MVKIKKNKKTTQTTKWMGFKPFRKVILEIFFTYKIYIYIGIACVSIPLICFPFLFFIFFGSQIFGKVMLIFIIATTLLNVPFWVTFFLYDPPIVRGAVFLTLFELLVISKGRVFFQIKWKDIEQIQLSKERIQGFYLSRKGYKLKFVSTDSSQILRLWSISVSKKNTKLLIDSIKKMANRMNITFTRDYTIKEITMSEATKIFDNVRNFNDGKLSI